MLILPWIDRKMLKRFERQPRKKDLYLARISILAITVGFAILGIAPGVGLSMFGNFHYILSLSNSFVCTFPNYLNLKK